MNLITLLAQLDDEKPNQYSAHTKTTWISEIEGKVIDEVLNMAEGNEIEFIPFDYETDAERELAIPERFTDVYISYLSAKIDLKNGELEKYNNEAAVFEATFKEFASYYRRNHMPKEKSQFRGW